MKVMTLVMIMVIAIIDADDHINSGGDWNYDGNNGEYNGDADDNDNGDD
jgi:hypothetical protein